MDAVVPEDVVEQIIGDVAVLDVGTLPATDDERELHRMMRYRSRVADELARVKAETAAMVKRLENQLAAVDYVLRPQAALIVERMLAGKKVRSVVTPYGKVGWRKQPERLEVENEDTVREAWQSGELPSTAVRREECFVVVKRELDALFDSGEIPPGCTVKPASDKFYMGD